MNLIGDIAGEYQAFRKLLSLMPAGKNVAVGDLNDRGKESRKVMDYFMEHPEDDALMGNHDLVFLDNGRSPRFSSMIDWLHHRNGGKETLKNFGWTDDDRGSWKIPQEYLDWCERRPFFLEYEDLLVTHAPLAGYYTLQAIREVRSECNLDTEEHRRDWINFWRELVWLRHRPIRREKFQVFGHLGVSHTRSDTMGTYAFCVDDSWRNSLVGLHWETKKLYRVPLE